LVPVEHEIEEDARQVLDAVNSKLASLGLEQFKDRDQVEAVICIVVRKEHNGGGIIGRTSTRKAVEALLEFMTDSGMISEGFAHAIYANWVAERIARQK
jgi:hypothetical protein